MGSRKAALAEALPRAQEEPIDDPTEQDVEAAWLAEVERRLHRVEQGSAKFEPWEAVHDRIAARLRAMRG